MSAAGLSREAAMPDVWPRETVEWCGHRVEGIRVPGEDGRWRLIVVEGEVSDRCSIVVRYVDGHGALE
jgi:hypothetical protein